MRILSIILLLYIRNPSDWEQLRNMRFVNSISCGSRYVYIAGDGLMRYDKLFNRWESPPTKTLFPTDIRRVVQDIYTGETWFVTGNELCKYTPTFEDYKLINLPSNAGICSVGVTDNYVYLWDRNKCLRFDKLSESFTTMDSLPSKIQWEPDVSPFKYSCLAPWYSLDKSLNRYAFTCADLDGQILWIGTSGDGVYKYDAVTCNVVEHYLYGFPSGGIRCLFKTGDTLWFSSPTKEIGNYIISTGHFSYYRPSNAPNLLNYEATAIVSNNNSIWIGSVAGLSQLNKSRGMWRNFTSSNLGQVLSLAVRGDELWVGTTNGLMKITNGVSEEILKDVCINDVKISSGVWIATDRGVFRSSLPTAQVGDSGSSKSTIEQWVKFDDPDKVMSHGVYKLLFEKNSIWFGSRQGVLVFKDNKWDRYTSPVHLPGNTILSLESDSSLSDGKAGNIYVGTNNGIGILDKSRNFWTIYNADNSYISGAVYSIVLDKEYAYFGTDNGIVRLKKQ